jgi:O-methyltransferase
MAEILKSIIRSIPPLHKLARRVRQGLTDEILDEVFFTGGPDVLIAIVKAFDLQRQRAPGRRDLLAGHAYYEFGMYKGFSFWFAEQLAREYTDSNFRFLGFDSFEGLPQPQLDVEARVFHKGQYRGSYEVVTRNLQRHKADFTKIRLYKGFYSKHVFDQLREKEQFPPVSVCLIDVDLYESCVLVLDFIKEYLVEGSILLFDDYNQIGENDNAGERRALIEFEKRNPGFKKEYLFHYGWEGIAFRVVSL